MTIEFLWTYMNSGQEIYTLSFVHICNYCLMPLLLFPYYFSKGL